MPKRQVFLFAFLFIGGLLSAQSATTKPKQWRLSTASVFQSHTLPFHDVKGHFQNPGISLSVGYPLGKASPFLVNIDGGLFSNRMMGNSVELGGSFHYHHKIMRSLEIDLGLGAGWKRIGHPVQAYAFKHGEWREVRNGRSQLILPLSLQLTGFSERIISPFIGYRWIPALFYNAVLPLNMYSEFQVGVKFNI